MAQPLSTPTTAPLIGRPEENELFIGNITLHDGSTRGIYVSILGDDGQKKVIKQLTPETMAKCTHLFQELINKATQEQLIATKISRAYFSNDTSNTINHNLGTSLAWRAFEDGLLGEKSISLRACVTPSPTRQFTVPNLSESSYQTPNRQRHRRNLRPSDCSNTTTSSRTGSRSSTRSKSSRSSTDHSSIRSPIAPMDLLVSDSD